jgi:HTH-type transcriptional regulator / antitoxin HigA
MQIKLIKTEDHYQKALNQLDKIFHAEPGTKEHEELEVIVMLIEKYEMETTGEFPDPDPIEAIKFKMEQMELNQKDLAKIIGLKSRASEILSRKRPMSINIIRKLSKALSIPADILIQPYKTA